MKILRRKSVLVNLSLREEIERFARMTTRSDQFQMFHVICYKEPITFKQLLKSFITPKEDLFLIKDTLKSLIRSEMIELYKNKYQLTDLGAVSFRRMKDMIESNESKSLSN